MARKLPVQNHFLLKIGWKSCPELNILTAYYLGKFSNFRHSEQPPIIEVRAITGFREIGPFIYLPYRLYRREKNWVPPIRNMEVNQFNPESNPALEHAEYQLWVAEKDGRVTGRIGCFINEMETQMRKEKQARFNWLEMEDDKAISQALLDTALDWAKSRAPP